MRDCVMFKLALYVYRASSMLTKYVGCIGVFTANTHTHILVKEYY
jgi:hypothetical protein